MSLMSDLGLAVKGKLDLKQNTMIAGTNITIAADGKTISANDTSVAFTEITAKPTTLAGYAITDAINVSQKGVTNGVATLDATGLVPTTQLPSFVDDVLEFANLVTFPTTGTTGKIYVDLTTNKTYRWSGTVYVYITSGAVDSVAGKTGVVTLVKNDVGLGSVDNTTDLLKPVSTATQTAIQSVIDTKVNNWDYNAADVLTKLKTVDGRGSGLDADFLGGKSETAFITRYLTAVTDWNTAIYTGYYSGNNALNAPTSDDRAYVGEVFANGSKITQTIHSQIQGSASNTMCYRRISTSENAWSAWYKVIMSEEDMGLGNVDNTSDASKPLSTAASNALLLKANQDTTYTKNEVDAKDAVYRSTEFAISGAINKVNRNFTFQETAANSLIVNAEKKYFKSLDTIVSPATTTVKFPQAPTATNLITNGTFDTDTSGWTASLATLSLDTNRIKVTSTQAGDAWAYQSIQTTVGKKYIVEGIATAGTGTSSLHIQACDIGATIELGGSSNNGYNKFEFIATTTVSMIRVFTSGTNVYNFYDNIAVFAATDLLRYDNLLLRDDGTYIITQTEQNQYITMDTMLNYTSTVHNVADGSSTGTSVTFTYDMTNEEYSGSDGHKYLTIGATARFNQGAYHPVFNPYGAAFSVPAGTTVGGGYWYANNDASMADCLVGLTTTPSRTGSISGNDGLTARPDGKFYDIIYNELWIDQRWRAEYVDGTKERTTIERDKDISASQYADFVGSATWETVELTVTNTGSYYGGNYFTVSPAILEKAGYTDDHYLLNRFYNRTQSSSIKTLQFLTDSNSESERYYISGSIATGNKLLYSKRSNLRYGSNTFLHTDIIGSPANYPTVWKDALAGGGSIAGTPLLVGENGEDYTSGIIQPKLSKKVSQFLVDVYYQSNDSSYHTISLAIEARPTNDWPSEFQLADYPYSLMYYKAYNNNLAPIVNSKVVGGSAGVSDVYASNRFNYSYGCTFASNSIGKILTLEGYWSAIVIPSSLTCTTQSDGKLMGVDVAYHYKPTHSTITLGTSISPAVKLFSYLTNGSTRHKQAYVFKEMKYDATGVNQDGSPTNTWGDNNQFSIVNNVSTATDNNGNTVIVGQKARLLDYRVRS